jgi:hypothetical protein
LLQHAFVKKLPRKSLTDYFQLIEGILQEKSNKNKSMNFTYFLLFFFLILFLFKGLNREEFSENQVENEFSWNF